VVETAGDFAELNPNDSTDAVAVGSTLEIGDFLEFYSLPSQTFG